MKKKYYSNRVIDKCNYSCAINYSGTCGIDSYPDLDLYKTCPCKECLIRINCTSQCLARLDLSTAVAERLNLTKYKTR